MKPIIEKGYQLSIVFLVKQKKVNFMRAEALIDCFMHKDSIFIKET